MSEHKKYRVGSSPRSYSHSVDEAAIFSLQKMPLPSPHPTGSSIAESFTATAPPYLRSYPSSTASSRSLLRDYAHMERRCLNPRCGCRLALLAIVVLLLIWGITIPLYFFVGPGRAEIQKAAEVHLMEQLPELHHAAGAHSDFPGTAKLANGTIFSAANVSIRVANQLFTPELEDPKSSHYRTLALQLETLLTIVFQKEPSFQRAVVRDFRLGTVVELTVILTEERPDIQLFVTQVITEYLINNWFMLGQFQMDLATLTVQYLLDPCKVANGGCSHLCFWSVLRSQPLCQCPPNYDLALDNATCQNRASAVNAAVHQPSPVCVEGQFSCGLHDDCIPEAWLCDGVSDCLQEADENPWICEDRLRSHKVQGGGAGSQHLDSSEDVVAIEKMALLHDELGRVGSSRREMSGSSNQYHVDTVGFLQNDLHPHTSRLDHSDKGQTYNDIEMFDLLNDNFEAPSPLENNNALRINIDESSTRNLDLGGSRSVVGKGSDEAAVINYKNVSS